MSWTEIDIGDLAPGMLGDAAVVGDLRANHDELYGVYAPTVLHGIPAAVTETSTTERTWFRFRHRANADKLTVRFKIYAVAASGTGGTVRCIVGANAGSATISGAAAEYTVDVTPSAGDPLECQIRLTAASSSSITVYAVTAYMVPVAVSSGTASSGFRQAGEILAPADAFASEVAQRLLRGPGQVLRDRPHAIVGHVRDLITTPKGTGFDWARASTAAWQVAGWLTWPIVCQVPRVYTLDCYLDDSGSDAKATIQVGSWTWDITAAGWSSTTVRLPPGPHPVSVAMTPGNVASTARIACFQAWRLE